MALDQWVEKFIKSRLNNLPVRVALWNGRTISSTRRPAVTLSLPSPMALRYLVRPSFKSLGEAYVEGHIQINGSALDAIRVIESLSQSTQGARSKAVPWSPRRRNPREDAEAVRFHYDVSNDFYRLWLGRDMVYSCAYFKTGSETLEQAQRQKLDYICRKLMLRPGERFLDIGCGWGGLIRWAARNYGVHATGITLSRNQYEHARELIRAERLENRCKVILCDYRALRATTPFDKIASVGMFEHVGLAQLPGYFRAIRSLLREGGLVLNHGICTSAVDPAYVGGDGGDFMDRYVFPYTELPHVTLAAREMSAQNLEVADIESLRPHYSLTLRHWLGRLEGNQERIERIAGDRRFRIWRAYLAGAAHAFDRGWISVYQVLAAKGSGQGTWALPLTRDHLYSNRAAGQSRARRAPVAVAS